MFIEVHDMTRLFTKEKFIYAISDFRFSKPLAFKKIGYFTFVFLLIGLPVLMIFPFNVYTTMTAFGLPAVLSNVMSKPIFNGRPFFAAMIVYTKYLFSNKFYYDNKPSKELGKYHIDEYYLVSRRKDFMELYKLKKQEEEVMNG